MNKTTLIKILLVLMALALAGGANVSWV